MQAATELWLGRIALVAGAAAAAVALLAWRVDGGSEAPAAAVAIHASSSDDLAVEPAGGSERAELRPSDPADGVERTFEIRNATGGTLAFRVAARPDVRELDRVLAVRVATGEATLYDGELRGLRTGSAPFTLASHASAELRVAAWIPREADGGWQARSVDVPLVFETTPEAR